MSLDRDRRVEITDLGLAAARDRLRLLAGAALEECPYSIERLLEELVECLRFPSTESTQRTGMEGVASPSPRKS